ncbi:MAG: cytoplasmic protein [Cyclobacteriaceae bacterium]
MTKELIHKAIDYATSNEEDLKNSELAACYYCKSIFKASEVKEFLETERTALCPKCGIDSVLPSNSPIELTTENLVELNKHWF